MTTTSRHSKKLWSIILAGGEGIRTRPLIERWLGYPKPKQFCAFIGNRSMLQHTWDRADRLTHPGRKMTVVGRAHRTEAWSQVVNRDAGKMVIQPHNRDTAAGVFLPLTYIRNWDPEATVVVYPSDHFVYPEEPFMQGVQRAIWAANRLSDRMFLVGVPPRSADVDYGWIHPGDRLAWSAGVSVDKVLAFLEKPNAQSAKAAMKAGACWNTLVIAAKVETLWNLGRQCLPEVMERFEHLGEEIGSPKEGTVLEDIYKHMPSRNFSSDLLQRIPEHAGMVTVHGTLWSDWGRPQRIVETLHEVGKTPAFPLNCLSEEANGSDVPSPAWPVSDPNMVDPYAIPDQDPCAPSRCHRDAYRIY